MEKLSKGDKVRVITENNRIYDIIVVGINGTEIHGTEYTQSQESQVVIQFEEILMIETKKIEAGNTVLFGILLLGAIAGVVIFIGFLSMNK